MKLSDERRELFELYTSFKKNGAISGQLEEFIDLLFSLIDKNEEKVSDLENRILKLEEFSEIISMDLFDIQSALLKKIDTDTSDKDGTDIFADFNDEDCEEDDGCDGEDTCDDNCSCGHCHDENCECDDEDDDDEEHRFIRCPYCNTLIFPNSDEKRIKCPFCGEKFLLSDVQ